MRAIVGFVGALLVLVGAYLLGTAEAQLNMEIERSIEMPLAEFRKLPEDVWSIVETERQSVLTRRRAAFGSILAGGGFLLVVALLTRRRLLGAVMVSFVAVILASAIFAVLSRKREPDAESAMEITGNEMKVETIVVWVAVGFGLVSLAWAGKIALAYRRRLHAVVGSAGARIDNP